MINEESLYNLYEKVINNIELTTKQLEECGFNSNDLKDLINQEILRRDKIGYYSFLDDDELFKYGKYLILLSQYEKAEICFKKCYQINPYSYKTCFQLFIRNVKIKNYEKAFEYFDKFFNSDNPFYNNDSDFYLYLLSFVTDVPEKYKAYSRCITFDDVKVSKKDTRYENIKLQNQLRQAVLNQKFGYAFKFFGEILKNGRMTQELEIIRTFLSQINKVQKDNNIKIIELLRLKNYDAIIKIMESIEERHNLNIIDEYVFIMAKDLKRIEKTKIIPEITNLRSNGMFDAIYNHDYVLALELSEKYNYKNSLTDDQNIIYCFLKEIVCLINKIQNETKYNVEENVLKAMRLINSGMSNVEVYILLDLKEYEIKIVEQFINEDKKLLKNVYLSMM